MVGHGPPEGLGRLQQVHDVEVSVEVTSSLLSSAVSGRSPCLDGSPSDESSRVWDGARVVTRSCVPLPRVGWGGDGNT